VVPTVPPTRAEFDHEVGAAALLVGPSEHRGDGIFSP